MAFTLGVFLAQVDNLLAAVNNELSQLARYRQIKQAVARYSIDRPDLYTEDVSGDGGRYYAITNLTKFVEDFSRVVAIEYPAYAVSADHAPTMLAPEDWDDAYYTSGNTRYLRFPNHSPASTETIRVQYTYPFPWTASSTTSAISQAAHGLSVNDYVYLEESTWIKAADGQIATHLVTVVTDSSNATAALLQTSIPSGDFFAVCNLAAGLCCQAIADKYSRTSDSTIAADSVGHTTRAGEFSARAKELMKLYEQHLKLGKDSNGTQSGYPAASQFVDFNTTPGWPQGRDYLWHRG